MGISHKPILMALPKALVMELIKGILGDFPNYDTSEESEAAGMYIVNYQCFKAPSTSFLHAFVLMRHALHELTETFIRRFIASDS